MFKNTYQNGLLSIFYSCGSNPLAIWDMEVKNGHIKRLTDKEVNSIVLEIVSTNVATTYISCPKHNQVLGIKLPFLVMIVKNLKRYFSFEITILDDKKMRRRFRISNFQSTTKIKPFCTSMPIGLSGGWNQIQFNLADFTKRAYGSQFLETLRVQVHANARLRRIYFSERLYTEDELPQEYKLYLPLDRKKKGKEAKKEDAAAATAAETVAPEPPAAPEPLAPAAAPETPIENPPAGAAPAAPSEAGAEEKPAETTAAEPSEVTPEGAPEGAATEEALTETTADEGTVTPAETPVEADETPVEEPGTPADAPEEPPAEEAPQE